MLNIFDAIADASCVSQARASFCSHCGGLSMRPLHMSYVRGTSRDQPHGCSTQAVCLDFLPFLDVCAEKNWEPPWLWAIASRMLEHLWSYTMTTTRAVVMMVSLDSRRIDSLEH